MKKLINLYSEHTGKVTDKWELYLREYDRIFSPYIKEPIRLLEIGVQNGGSLEIWAKFFPNAAKFIGCDIDSKCVNLTYENPKIKIIVGDALSDQTENEIAQYADRFDVIIEDGSHTSADIIKTFVKYFPRLSDGGVFIAEDMHCSYWECFNGGVFYPYSSIAFFKALVDLINYDHWGNGKSKSWRLAGFFEKYDIDLSENVISSIHSIEFIDSICVIHKREENLNKLGKRHVVGLKAEVDDSVLAKQGELVMCVDQTENYWSNLDGPPEQLFLEILQRNNELLNENRKVKTLVADLKRTIETQTAEMTRYHLELNEIKESKFWRARELLKKLY